MQRAAGSVAAGSVENRDRDRLEESVGDAVREAIDEHDDAHAAARRLPVRAKPDRGTVEIRGCRGGARRVLRKAQAEFQGKLSRPFPWGPLALDSRRLGLPWARRMEWHDA